MASGDKSSSDLNWGKMPEDFRRQNSSYNTPWRHRGGSRLVVISILNLGARWDRRSAPRPGGFTSRKTPVPFVQEVGWAPGPIWTGAKITMNLLSSWGTVSFSRTTLPVELIASVRVTLAVIVNRAQPLSLQELWTAHFSLDARVFTVYFDCLRIYERW